MQLRRRLLVSISLVLLISLLAGALLSYWTAVRKIDLEMSSSLAVGEGAVRDAIAPLAGLADPAQQLQTLVSSFDGDRHLRAAFVAADGREIMVSRLRQPLDPPPRWLYRFLAGTPQSTTIVLPEAGKSPGAMRLQTDPWNEIAEVWEDAKLKFLIVSGFSAAVLALVYLIMGRALQPLETLSSALVRVGRGDYGAHVAETGPKELATIYREFNRMAGRLAEAEKQNQRLNEQLSTVQDEERSEIARDLHDDVGPFLFAVDVDAQTIPALLDRDDKDAVTERAHSIRQSVSHMQTHLRSILSRLRPALLLDLGLSHAVDHLVAFWRARRPKITFNAAIAQESFGATIDEVAFRIIQEGLANALRHANPKTIDIAAHQVRPGVLQLRVSDDGGGIGAASAEGFGLTGMRERIAALGGSCTISASDSRSGVTITAELPLSPQTKSAQTGRDDDLQMPAGPST